MGWFDRDDDKNGVATTFPCHTGGDSGFPWFRDPMPEHENEGEYGCDSGPTSEYEDGCEYCCDSGKR